MSEFRVSWHFFSYPHFPFGNGHFDCNSQDSLDWAAFQGTVDGVVSNGRAGGGVPLLLFGLLCSDCREDFPDWLGQKSCRTKVPRIFRIFVPNFAPNFPRIFRGVFVLCFVGIGDQKKFAKNPRLFSMQNSQANTKKIFTKCFWRAGKVTTGSSSRSPHFAHTPTEAMLKMAVAILGVVYILLLS